jgi:hypothetical protein
VWVPLNLQQIPYLLLLVNLHYAVFLTNRNMCAIWPVLRIRNAYPGSRIQGQKDSGSRIPIRIKEFKYFEPKKLFLSSWKYDPGCSSRIGILIFYPTRAPDPGFGSTTLDLASGPYLQISKY